MHSLLLARVLVVIALPSLSHCTEITPIVNQTYNQTVSLTPSTTQSTPPTINPLDMQLDRTLLHDTYASTFRLRDGSALSSVDSEALNAMRGSVQRLLAVGDNVSFLNHTRTLPDSRLLSILLLAVAGNFTVDQSPSALPQKCGIVVDSGSGALMLRDNAVAQSVILEVLLIVSIVCLVRAWGAGKAQNK